MSGGNNEKAPWKLRESVPEALQQPSVSIREVPRQLSVSIP